MFDRILTFGDSYMAGTELPQQELGDPIPHITKATGKIPPPLEYGQLPMKFITPKHRDLIQQYELDNITDHHIKSKNLVTSGLLATHYGIDDYENLAVGGASLAAILSTVLANMDKITPNTLVILGITFPYRRTKFGKPSFNNYGIYSFNNSIHVVENNDHRRYIELDDQYGDDLLSYYTIAYGIIAGIHQLLSQTGCKFIMIDPVNIYRPNPELSNKLSKGWMFDDPIKDSHLNADPHSLILQHHEKRIDTLTNKFSELLYPYTLTHGMMDIHKQGKPFRCWMGHPTAEVHEQFVSNYLIPHIDQTFGDAINRL